MKLILCTLSGALSYQRHYYGKKNILLRKSKWSILDNLSCIYCRKTRYCFIDLRITSTYNPVRQLNLPAKYNTFKIDHFCNRTIFFYFHLRSGFKFPGTCLFRGILRRGILRRIIFFAARVYLNALFAWV